MFFPLPSALLWSLLFAHNVCSLPYEEDQVRWNLNTNKNAQSVSEYSGAWEGHVYQESPENWRFPLYTLFMDRFVNGDPTNDDANGTAYEHDIMSNQFRNGGDVKGLMNSLDYLQGMGIKGLYLAGSVFINQPWAYDNYSPLDLTLLDHHFGDIEAWRAMISECHKRGIYVILDNTMSTMGDLLSFKGYLNESAPFKATEHDVIWKSPRRYRDFELNEELLPHCDYPRFWDDTGAMVGRNVTDKLKQCRKSEFDQYGDVTSLGVYPEWRKQLSKFGFVQDRLREWRPSVLDKIKLFSCLTIQMLDIDGYRIDKALTITIDAQAEWSQAMRECAADLGKKNFFIPGEVVGGNTLAAVYFGRGKEPHMAYGNAEEAMSATNVTSEQKYIRTEDRVALDAGAFHYSIYRGLTRYLGIDGIYAAERDTPVNWVDAWNLIVKTNDLVNANTGEWDPRHMYGVTNQDVFRWPGLTVGTERNLAGLFVTTLLLPGVPTLMWGEEQAFYVLENTAANYIFGRAPMTSQLAWQIHGCYTVGTSKYTNFPMEKAYYGCLDEKLALDHRDPSHPARNIIKRMYEIRRQYPTVNDGYILKQLSNHTYNLYLPGSNGTETETGLWSSYRAASDAQDFTGQGKGNQPVWLLYSNENTTVDYTWDCNDEEKALISPFAAGTKIRNLFYPYEELTLTSSPKSLNIGNSTGKNGCLPSMSMGVFDYAAFVPSDQWEEPAPVITEFTPGHDHRIVARVGPGETETVAFGFKFSSEMDCDSVTDSISIESNTLGNVVPKLDPASVKCQNLDVIETIDYPGGVGSEWVYSAELTNVANGVHAIIVTNPKVNGGDGTTGTTDRFMFRIGQPENPIVFPRNANYSSTLLVKNNGGGSDYVLKHSAPGATSFRYSVDWKSSFTNWAPYTGEDTPVISKNWTGTDAQKWKGEHVYVQYFSEIAASSNHFQHGDVGNGDVPRRLPHLHVQGPFNQFSFDAGIPGTMKQMKNGSWYYDLMTEWPTSYQFNEWGMNPSGQPDNTLILGDIDHDNILDRIPPGSLLVNVINVTEGPESPYTAWRIVVDDATFTFFYVPVGNRWMQLALYILLSIVPILSATLVIYIFIKTFYGVKFNQLGVDTKQAIIPLALRRRFKKKMVLDEKMNMSMTRVPSPRAMSPAFAGAGGGDENPLHADLGGHRRSVLIATMEYDIEDWEIKIKIGGLGVMAQLMGKNLGHQDLIWVVPCVQGVDYPLDEVAESMYITVLGKQYEIMVQYHVLRNITYVLLDAPIFRKQSKSEPYPARMDDLESAIYYSAWNQCIAQAITRFDVDLYHINDYHGGCAPLYLLPSVIPCALSLHNAEFQGLWPMRTPQEREEVCNVFHLDPAIAQKYVQFGEVFNLLHAAASYLRIHQKGFGAVGVSKKYGKRTFARYPIFWGLSKIGSLPNPDPTDTGAWDRNAAQSEAEITADLEAEAKRPDLKRQAQEWANLNVDPEAELFVFVGRWSMQKGVDLIADVFPSILQAYPKTQLITVGPVIDLYGRFAALKLAKMMELYPGRVFSKPEFTSLPPYIFSGSEFALIPSRDEPFGLVAVEFGRKGALGVGARVGGLGQMPGWWYTVESMTPKHLVHQFKMAIHEALASSQQTRAVMRARSAKQRFPVAQWVEDLDTLQSTAIMRSKDEENEALQKNAAAGLSSPSLTNLRTLFTGSRPASGASSPNRLSVNNKRASSLAPPGSPGDSPWMASGQWTPMRDMPLPPGARDISGTNSPASPNPQAHEFLLSPPVGFNDDAKSINTSRFSTLSYDSVAKGREDFALQKVDPAFTDASGVYLKAFEKKLEALGPKSSENLLCIEEHLIKSEKSFFNDYRAAKLGTAPNSRAPSIRAPSIDSRPGTPTGSYFPDHSANGSVDSMVDRNLLVDEFAMGADYVPPNGIKRFLLYRIADWPIYTILLAFGQIIAANSYQITLLIGEIGQTATELYIIATIYAVSSVCYWLLFRRVQSVYCLSIPFVFYGLAFFLIGMAPFASGDGRGWVQKTATGLYALASASGALFFALNFGDEGGAQVKTWVLRACIVQGTQHIYISALWYWGSSLVKLSSEGVPSSKATVSNTAITSITLPIACLMWVVGVLLWKGLPDYYRSVPGKVPSFYKSIFRRKIILWFFIFVLIQNYWLSAPYGRNWRYLWTTQHAPVWAIALLVLVFFVIIWALLLIIFSRLSKSHSWILPVFAIGLGAPRWCQMLWATSAAGHTLPWAGGAVSSALLGRCLWLWLGVLDAIQGVGFGMILLQTMTRFHISFTLIAAQVLGSIATILGRLTAPNNTGPGSVFPNLALGASGLASPAFWICLFFQIAVCIGFALFFRKEQLSKP